MAVVNNEGIFTIKKDDVFCLPTLRRITYSQYSGRFELKSSSFFCCCCKTVREADARDYIASGFWPGTPNYYDFGDFIKHNTPGTSSQKFVACLEAMGDGARRVTLSLSDTFFID